MRLIQVDGNNGSWSSAIPDNTSWHHYAITWNAGTVTLYVDGVSKGTQSQTAGSGTPQYGLTLGANNDEYYTELTLDEMGIWKRVLTTSEISALYNSGTGSIVTEAKDATWIGNFDLTGLKAYYKFDESSGNIINQATSVGSSDSLGSNADMTISGATYSQTGKIGNALSFDGSNDYGTLGSSLSQWNLFHGTGDWSINFWVNYDEFEAESRFFSNMDSTETRGINLGVGWSGNPDGQIGLSIKSNGGFMTNNGGINFPTDISGTGTWVMITVVADYSDTTNTYTVYLNGVAGSSQARAVAGSTGDSEYSLKLGSRGNYADKFFDGSFDEMTIWSRVLTADEITSLYNANIGKIVY